MNYQTEIQQTVKYLASDEALKCMDADPYWPKWNGPWWQMLLLHEMGETSQIPKIMIQRHIASLNRLPLKTFIIDSKDIPQDIDPFRGSPCHCQLGNVYQVLSTWGIDVDKELPWIRSWLLKSQMADGGLNCDNEAYLVTEECPSSMVGTISAFEAILLHTNREWTPEEKNFLNKAADFLMQRQLMHGSSTKYNSSERKSAEHWLKLCFPRFYFYDVLRGLNALSLWAEKTNQTLSYETVSAVMYHLKQQFSDGNVTIERLSYLGNGTYYQTASGKWLRKSTTELFPLLEKVSTLYQISPYLSQQWSLCQMRIASHFR